MFCKVCKKLQSINNFYIFLLYAHNIISSVYHKLIIILHHYLLKELLQQLSIEDVVFNNKTTVYMWLFVIRVGLPYKIKTCIWLEG